MSRFKAFSLAEVLIVVALIGVVASLTIPNVSSNMEEHKSISALRKIYPELEAAYNDIIAEHGKPIEWSVSNTSSKTELAEQMYNYTREKLNVNKVCSNGTGCFKSYNELETAADHVNYYKMILKDGAFLAVGMQRMGDIRNNVKNNTLSEDFCRGYMGKYIVDVNGMKGENAPGYDIFEFYMCYDTGLTPDGDTPDGPKTTAGVGTAWALKAGNRDYLKCASSLNWNTKRSCK